jgi:GH15 family glucan-1,4-alpha-glucosidase
MTESEKISQQGNLDVAKDDPTIANLQLAAIGNCSFSALLDRRAQVVWSCFPRVDGDPIFCSLVKRNKLPGPSKTRGEESNEIGFWDICISNFERSEQKYLNNSAVVSTKLFDKSGSGIEITDFVPRFESFDREFRPMMMIRVVTPIKGRPRIQVRLRPTFGYGWGTPERTRGSNHIRYLLSTMTIRLTSNAPISYIAEEVFFEINEPVYLLLMPDESLKTSLEETSTTFLKKTLSYWRNWVRTLTIPFEWQEEVIRACITLKLNNFEETGAIVAAQTTSIPNGPNGKNYDYRYCWLRDSYWVVKALNQLGSTATLSNYLKFLSNIVADISDLDSSEKRVQSVYGVSLETRLNEREMHRLSGYRAQGPVVLGTLDAENTQHDVYGSVVLALTQYFFDKRLEEQGSELLFKQLEEFGERAVACHDKPDSGPTAKRAMPMKHTVSTVMCWAACDRLAKIANQLKNEDRAKYWKDHADKIRSLIMKVAYNDKLKSFVSVWDSSEDTVDAFLLFLPEVGFVDAKDPAFTSTLKVIEQKLKVNSFIKMNESDEVAHISATCLYIKALDAVGRSEEARDTFNNLLASCNHVGIASENICPTTKELWGNLPHSTATCGLIDCALKLSKSWNGAF